MTRRRAPRPGVLLAAAVVGALLPLAAAAAGSASSWRPMGDTAVLVLRARDVVGGEGGVPLVGMPTTLGQATGRSLHHPGPSELWLLSPAAASGPSGLVLLTVVLSNALWIAVAVVALFRAGGPRAAAVGGGLLAAMSASVAADTLVDPLNPNFGLLPYVAFLASTLALVQRAGRWWFPIAAVAGTLAAQAHVTLAALVGAGALVALVSLRRPDGPGVRAPLAAGLLALLVLWSPVLVDQATRSGNAVGLLAAVAGGGAGGGEADVAGWDHAARVLAHGLGRPAWLAAADGLEAIATQPAHRYVVAALLLAVLAGAALRRRGAAAVAGRLLLGCLAVGAVATARLPDAFFSLAALHNSLWLWPLATGAAAVAVLAVVHRLRVPTAAVSAAGLLVSLVATGLVAAGPARPAVPPWTPAVDRATPRVLEALGDRDRTIHLDVDGEFRRFGIGAALALELEEAGHRVVVDEDLVPSFGAGRARPAADVAADAVVVVTTDEAALRPEGARPVSTFRDPLGVTSIVWLASGRAG